MRSAGLQNTYYKTQSKNGSKLDEEMYKLLSKFGKAEHFKLGANSNVHEKNGLNSSKDQISTSKTMNMKKQNVAMHTTRNNEKNSMYRTHF